MHAECPPPLPASHHRPCSQRSVSGLTLPVPLVPNRRTRAEIDQIHAHRLRHAAAMDVLAAGGSLAEAKEFLGHVDTVTTMAYATVDLASLRELVVPFGQVPR